MIGVAVGCFIFVLIVIGLIVWYCKRKRRTVTQGVVHVAPASQASQTAQIGGSLQTNPNANLSTNLNPAPNPAPGANPQPMQLQPVLFNPYDGRVYQVSQAYPPYGTVQPQLHQPAPLSLETPPPKPDNASPAGQQQTGGALA